MTSQLFQLLTSRQWDKALDLIRSRPEEAQTLLTTGKRGAAPISALHVVLAHSKCRGDVPLPVVQELLKVAPEMVKTKHLYTGNLPLHAVFYNAFFSAAKRKALAEMILEAHPESLTARNNDGRTPLHTNCSQHCNHEPIIMLLEKAPETARWADRNGDYPIHLACRSQKSPNKSIETLFNAYPEGILKKNKDGCTPLEVTIQGAFLGQKRRSRISLLLKFQRQVLNTDVSIDETSFEMTEQSKSLLEKRKRKKAEVFVSMRRSPVKRWYSNIQDVESDLEEESTSSEAEYTDPPKKRCRSNTMEFIPVVSFESAETESRQEDTDQVVLSEDVRTDVESTNTTEIDEHFKNLNFMPSLSVDKSEVVEAWSSSAILVAMKKGRLANEGELTPTAVNA